MNEFKTGDCVKITKDFTHLGWPIGKIAVVIRKVLNSEDYTIRDEGANDKNFWHKFFELVERFEIGQKIESIENRVCGYDKGAIAKVLQICDEHHENAGQLVVQFDGSDEKINLWGWRFKKIEQPSSERLCNCDKFILMNRGCQCGGK